MDTDLTGMAAQRAYLDFNASAPLLPEARAAVVAALAASGNASSVHAEGRSARRIVETARADVALLAGAKPENVVFTSGASEAASMLLSPEWRMGRGTLRMSRLYVGATEHTCMLSGGRFQPGAITVLDVDGDGVIDTAGLERALSAHDRSEGMALVAVQAANNETGVVQPLAKVSEIVHAAGAVLAVDAVQAAGRMPADLAALGADYAIYSAHKIGGPQGAGAVVSASDVMMPMPLVSGGGQERGFRAGTENIAAIAGFGAAARHALAGLSDIGRVEAKRDRMEAMLLSLAGDATIFGRGAARLPNTTCFALPGMKAETLQIAFDLAGVAVSAGSACSSGKVGPSHVLKAMGSAEPSGVRVSLGLSTSEEEIALFSSALSGIVARRKQRPDNRAA